MLELSSSWRAALLKIEQVMSCATLVAAVWFIFAYLIPAIFRVHYPFELEWMEGGMVDHVRWLLAGRELYQRPSLDFTAFIYPPFYFYLAAGLSKVFGIGFFPLRLISLLSTIGTGVFLFLLARHELKQGWRALLVPGLFLATYPLSGSWMDLGRVDNLMLFLLCASIYILRRFKGEGWMILAGILAVLAFYTKQLVWVPYLALTIWLLFEKRYKDVLVFCGTGIVLTIPIFAWLQWKSQGWFWYYLVDVPSQHLWEWDMLTYFWKIDILLPLSIVSLFAGMFVALRRQIDQTQWRFGLALLLGGLIMGWLGRLHTGGYENVLLPTYAILVLVGVLGFYHLQTLFLKQKLSTLPLVANALLLIQFAVLWYDPRFFVPAPEMYTSQRQFQSVVTTYAQPIWVQSHSFYDLRVDTPIQAHLMAIADIIRGSDEKMREELRQAFEERLSKRFYSTIIIDDAFRWERALVERYYKRIPRPYQGESWELSGAVTYPEEVYVPRE